MLPESSSQPLPTKWTNHQAFTPVLEVAVFRVLILSEPFVSQSLMVNFVTNLVHCGFGPSSEAQQFFLMN